MSIIITTLRNGSKYTFVYPTHLAAQKEQELIAQGYIIISKEWSK
jgi:hypothetical protein